MNILIAGGDSPLALALVDELAQDHQLRLLVSGPPEVPDGVEVMQGSILHPEVAWRAVRGMEAVIHTGEPPDICFAAVAWLSWSAPSPRSVISFMADTMWAHRTCAPIRVVWGSVFTT